MRAVIEVVEKKSGALKEKFYRIRVSEIAYREDNTPFNEIEFTYRTADNCQEQLAAICDLVEARFEISLVDVPTLIISE